MCVKLNMPAMLMDVDRADASLVRMAMMSVTFEVLCSCSSVVIVTTTAVLDCGGGFNEIWRGLEKVIWNVRAAFKGMSSGFACSIVIV